MSEAVAQYLQGEPRDLREFAITFARLIGALAMDPHGYFEKKYTARIERSDSSNEIRGVLAQLTQWAGSSALSDAERARLDAELGEKGMPTIADLRANLLI